MDFLAKHWGDLAGVLGLAITIWFAFQAKGAAEQARDAAKAARDRIFSFDTVQELTATKVGLNEIIRLQRLNALIVPWDIVLDRYGNCRHGLVRCAEGLGIPDAQRRAIGEAIVLLRIMIVDIDQARVEEDLGRLDTVSTLSILIDELERARIAIERAET